MDMEISLDRIKNSNASKNIQMDDIFKGFSKLNREQRIQKLIEIGALSSEDAKFLENGGLQDTGLAEKFIENVIGYFQMPIGVATNFKIDGRDFVIPMAVEETSIVAAASKTAKWVRENGSITTEIIGTDIIGQIQLGKVKNFVEFESRVLKQKMNLFELQTKKWHLVWFGVVAESQI
jgi:hydroxymethylglutaryl-CoA reductase